MREVEYTMAKTYNEDTIIQRALGSGYDITPVPDTLTINWDYGIYFDEVMDGSSLVWIDVMQDTFNEQLPGHNWIVDDPGTLYWEGFDPDDENPFKLSELQGVADLALDRYRSLFEKAIERGVPVEAAQASPQQPTRAEAPDWVARAHEALDANISVERMVELSEDTVPVRQNLTHNRSLPADLLEKLANDVSWEVRSHAAMSPKLSVETMKRLAVDQDKYTRRMIGYNSATPAEVLDILLHDDDSEVRGQIVNHPNLPETALRTLMQDEAKFVADWAKKFASERGRPVQLSSNP